MSDASEPASKDSIAANQKKHDLAVTELAKLAQAIYSWEGERHLARFPAIVVEIKDGEQVPLKMELPASENETHPLLLQAPVMEAILNQRAVSCQTGLHSLMLWPSRRSDRHCPWHL